MAKVKMVLNWCIPMVLIAVELMTATIAQAGSRKIWPDQLKPMDPNTDAYQQVVSYVSNGEFFAPLTLPTGATITKITYYHFDSSAPAQTSLFIEGMKMGEFPYTLGYGSSSDSTGAMISVDVDLAPNPTIRAGYRYYIRVQSSSGSYLMGVKITYQE